MAAISIGRFHDRSALVVGAGSGIGKAVARMLADEGAFVSAADVDEEAVQQTAQECDVQTGSTCSAVLLDVSSEQHWNAAITQIEAQRGSLDILVNCVGVADEAPLTELTLAQWKRVMKINLEGAFLGTAAGLRAMKKTGRGAIVNVSSLSGVKASAGAAAYCTSKAGLIQLSRVAALECAEAGNHIRVNCVAPGGVKTPMWEKTPLWPAISQTNEWTAPPDAPPAKRFAEPEEIAKTILFLASDESSYISGATLMIDGGAA